MVDVTQAVERLQLALTAGWPPRPRRSLRRMTMDMVERVAAALDPEIWAIDLPIPTRANTEVFHIRRRKSVLLARAAIAAMQAGQVIQDLLNMTDCGCLDGDPARESARRFLAGASAPARPTREEVARVLAAEFSSRPWDKVAANRRELKILASSNKAYSFSEDTKEDFLSAADAILQLIGKGG
jgi:hypothetical protein